SGEAIRGKVLSVDAHHKEPGRRRDLLRPLIEIQTRVESRVPVGEQLWWSEELSIGGIVDEMAPAPGGVSRVTISITSGRRKELPIRGANVCFSSLKREFRPPLRLPDSLPWTHEPAAEVPFELIEDGAQEWEETP